MAEDNKILYFLKFPHDFFNSRRIKKLRKMDGGDLLIVLYLKLQLSTLETKGYIYLSGIEDDPAEEIALELDEKPDAVRTLLDFLFKCGLAEKEEDGSIFLPYVEIMTTSHTKGAERKRKYRENKSKKESESGTQMGQPSDTDGTNVGQARDNVPTEYKNIRVEENREKKEDANASKKEGGKTAFRAPSIEDVEAYCKSEGFDQTDADDFVNFYQKKGWRVGKDKMKDWKAAVRNWENTERKRRGLPTIGEMRKAAEKKNREAETIVEYPVGSGRMIPEVQARREANRDGAFVEYPTGSGKFIPVYEAEAIRKGKPINGK